MDSLKILFSEIIVTITVKDNCIPNMVCIVLDRAKYKRTINNDIFEEIVNLFSDKYVSVKFID